MHPIRLTLALGLLVASTVQAEDQVRANAGGVQAQADADGITVQLVNRDDGPWLSVENRGETGTVHCRGRNVSVSGKRNQITLQGDCPFIEVSGDENELQIESVGEISLSGDDNRLSWQRSSRGSAPAVGDDGDGNRVERSAD